MWSFTNKVRSKIVGKKSPALLVSVFLLGAGGLIATADNANRIVPPFQIFADPDGAFATLNLGGPTDTTTNPFFQDLGSNGRRCVTCHQPSDAWSVTPPHVRARFAASNGTDPIFRPVDGANCPSVDVSTLQERREAYSLLLSRGLIRVGIAVPANADYQMISVYNRYGCNATDVISMYRRPLSTTTIQLRCSAIWRTSPWTRPSGTRKGTGRGRLLKNSSKL